MTNLRNFRNPIRRNKNIGTSKQGYKKNNKFVIPEKYLQRFYENLKNYIIVKRIINDQEFTFVVEETRKKSIYPVTIQDLEFILKNIEFPFFDELNLIVLRQPKKKEELLYPVWGRLLYTFEFENDYKPAIILESQEFPNTRKWSKKICNEDKNELKLLEKDGIKIYEDKRNYIIEVNEYTARKTQLYRTFLHEIGHYQHYYESIINPLKELKNKVDNAEKKIDELELNYNEQIPNELWSNFCKLSEKYDIEYNLLWESYYKKNSLEKELFANNYSEQVSRKLKKKNIIPFDKILDKEFIIENKLRIHDFSI